MKALATIAAVAIYLAITAVCSILVVWCVQIFYQSWRDAVKQQALKARQGLGGMRRQAA